MADLPLLNPKELGPTRDYLQGVALVMSSLQRAFLPKHPRQWQYGLEVSMRGLSTQEFPVVGVPTRANLDLYRYNFRLDGSKWALHEYAPPELFNNVKAWLSSKGVEAELEEPKFKAGVALFDTAQVDAYAEALWWLEKQFRILKATIDTGLTAPVLLYAHHFDLSLVWFPFDDDRQLAVGWSTGDEHIAEPYIYLTAYPEPKGFTDIKLPPAAHWQAKGFSGAILPYAKLQASRAPEKLFQEFAKKTFDQAVSLLG